MEELTVYFRVFLFWCFWTCACCDSEANFTEDQVYLSENIFDSKSGDQSQDEDGILVSSHPREVTKRHLNFGYSYPTRYARTNLNIVNGKYQYYLDKPGNKLSEWHKYDINNNNPNSIYWVDTNSTIYLHTTENYADNFDSSMKNTEMLMGNSNFPLSTPMYDELYVDQPKRIRAPNYIHVDCGERVVKLSRVSDTVESDDKLLENRAGSAAAIAYDMDGRPVTGTHVDEMGNRYKITCIPKNQPENQQESEPEKLEDSEYLPSSENVHQRKPYDRNSYTYISGNKYSYNNVSQIENEKMVNGRMNEAGYLMKRHMSGTQEDYENELRQIEQLKYGSKNPGIPSPETVSSDGTSFVGKEIDNTKQNNIEPKNEVTSFLDKPVSNGVWNNNNGNSKGYRNYVLKQDELVYWHPNKKLTNTNAENEVKPNGIKLLQENDWTKHNEHNMMYTVDNRGKNFYTNSLNKNIQIIQDITTITPVLNQDLPRTMSAIVLNSVFNHVQNKIKMKPLNETIVEVPLNKPITKIRQSTSFFSAAAALGDMISKPESKDNKKSEFFNGDAVIRSFVNQNKERNRYSYPWHSITNKFGGQIMEAKIFSRAELKPPKIMIEEMQNRKVESKPLNFFEIKHYDFEEKLKSSSSLDQTKEKEGNLLYREGKEISEPINFSSPRNINGYSTMTGTAPRKFTRKTITSTENNTKNNTFFRHYQHQSSNSTVYKPKYYYSNKEKTTPQNMYKNQTFYKKVEYQSISPNQQSTNQHQHQSSPNQQIYSQQSTNQHQILNQHKTSTHHQPSNQHQAPASGLHMVTNQHPASNQHQSLNQHQASNLRQTTNQHQHQTTGQHQISNHQMLPPHSSNGQHPQLANHQINQHAQLHLQPSQQHQQFPAGLPRSHSKTKNYPKNVPIFKPKANRTAKHSPCYEESLNSITFTNRVLRKPNKKCTQGSEESTDKIDISTMSPFKKQHFNIKIAEESCQTADGEFGTCVNLYHCLPSMRDGITDTDLMKLVYCGFDGIVPMVCCPNNNKAKPQQSILKIMLTPRPPTVTQSNKKRYSNYDLNVPQKPPYCGRSTHEMKTVDRDTSGFPAELGHFPWMVLLGYRNSTHPMSWACSGSLITSQHVLSSAYCIDKKPSYARVGELDLNIEDELSPTDVRIQLTVVHEHYNAMIITNDIGIAVLEKEIKFSKLVSPICLPIQQSVQDLTFEKYMPVLAGWKFEKNSTQLMSRLRAFQLPVVTTRQCAKSYSKVDNIVISESVLCAGFRKTSFLVDSGAPLMQLFWNDGFSEPFYYQIGILSGTQPSDNTLLPAVFTRVTHFLPWLQKQLAQSHLL